MTPHKPPGLLDDGVVRLSLGVLLLGASLVLSWLLFAPRDWGGMICRDSTPMRSMLASLRGKRELGCVDRDGPILEAPLSWRKSSVD
jgi:hypothetical protein